jgi:lysozyme
LKISQRGIDLIKRFEGCELEAYRDLVGKWTIGYGHTKGVNEGMRITDDQAEHMLTEELKEFESYINNYVFVDLQQNQFDALTSWVYNLGPTNLRSSTMLKVLNAGKYTEVPYQMKRWNRAGGLVSKGLTRRREAEARLFEDIDEQSD